MNTSKPISTISYNTEKFLKTKLDEMVKAKIIESYFYIFHKAENGNNGDTVHEKKDHYHVYCEPNKRINTMDFSEQFIQKVKGEKLPRKCIDIKNSKFEDWFLYSLHNKTYLAKKLLQKQFHYNVSEMKCNDEDLLQYRSFAVFHESKIFENDRLLNYLNSGGSVTDLARCGFIEPHKAFQYLCFSKVYNGMAEINDIAITGINPAMVIENEDTKVDEDGVIIGR